MPRLSDDEKAEILAQAKRDAAREKESDEQKWMRAAIAEAVRDELRGFFTDDNDDGEEAPPKKGGPGSIIDGLFGSKAG